MCYSAIKEFLLHKISTKQPKLSKDPITVFDPKEQYPFSLNFILTRDELESNLFPSEETLKDPSSGYIQFDPTVPQEHYLLAVDCEMVFINNSTNSIHPTDIINQYYSNLVIVNKQ